MFRALILIICLHSVVCQQYQQKVAPGVPPQNYQYQQQQPPPPPPPQQMQNQPPQQQYQQQQQQYQPPPQQQQQYQPPPQQFQPQQVQQQQPPQQGHGQGHNHAHAPGDLLKPTNMEEERGHIQEHMDIPLDVDKMSEDELQFYYFKMHDNDNNNMLDGCELVKSLMHWHAEQEHKQKNTPGATPVAPKIFGDEELVNLIDPILNMDDHNRDGYIDYPEFVNAQQKNKKQSS